MILTSSVLETYPKPLRTLASTATQAAASLFKLSANTSFNNPDIFNNLFLFPRIYDFFNCFLTYQFIPLFSFFILLNSSLSLNLSLSVLLQAIKQIQYTKITRFISHKKTIKLFHHFSKIFSGSKFKEIFYNGAILIVYPK